MIDKFQALGWEGPITARKHSFMVNGTRKVRIPNPHEGDIDVSLLSEILRQAGIDHDAWNRA